ncbi:hypothetical protein ACTXT7_003927 [Hymenolepis weldensis]
MLLLLRPEELESRRPYYDDPKSISQEIWYFRKSPIIVINIWVYAATDDLKICLDKTFIGLAFKSRSYEEDCFVIPIRYPSATALLSSVSGSEPQFARQHLVNTAEGTRPSITYEIGSERTKQAQPQITLSANENDLKPSTLA